MINVNVADLIETKPALGEIALKSYFQEASALGLKPGHWPNSIYLVTESGNKVCLDRKTLIKANDPYSGWTYRSHGWSIKLNIFND